MDSGWLLLLFIFALVIAVVWGRPESHRIYRAVRIKQSQTGGWIPQYRKHGWFGRSRWVNGKECETYEAALDVVNEWHSVDLQKKT